MVINNPKGILLMTIGMALFAFADTVAKLLLENYPTLQVVFVRQLGLFAGVTIFMISTKSWVGKTSHLKLQLFRAIIIACFECFCWKKAHLTCLTRISATLDDWHSAA